jgi:hypothetical protein
VRARRASGGVRRYACSIKDAATSDFIDQLIKVDISQRAVTHRWSQASA